jgi:hypothetical protein
MTTYPSDHDPQEPFNIQRMLGRIEEALVNMAEDIHEAVSSQKKIIERLERDEARIGVVENWKETVNERNQFWIRVALLLLLPALAGGISAGVYMVKVVHDYESHIAQPKPKP